MAPLDTARQNRLQEILSEEKRRLWTELRREIFHDLGEGMHGQYEVPQDIGEQGLIDLLSDTGLAVAEIRKAELIRLEGALERLEEGRYGTCEECGEEIDEERLKVVPYAACCVTCQKEREGAATPAPPTL